MAKQRYKIKIGRTTIEVCSACYQRLRAAGRIKTRPYSKKEKQGGG